MVVMEVVWKKNWLGFCEEDDLGFVGVGGSLRGGGGCGGRSGAAGDRRRQWRSSVVATGGGDLEGGE